MDEAAWFILKKREIEAIEQRHACEESLRTFTETAWGITDPGEPFVGGYAMDAICDHIQAVHSGNITRLLITVPPGFSKSTITQVMYPAWAWIHAPERRFISVSYSEDMPTRDMGRCLRIMKHPWYQRNWGHLYELIKTSAAYMVNDKTGWRKAIPIGAASSGGGMMGWRANNILLDDPNNPKGEESKVRISTNTWFREVLPSRLNNMARDAIILIQQRLHLEDCAGTALGMRTRWVHLNIPMEYEPRIYVNGYRADSDKIETFYDEDVDMFCREAFWLDWRHKENELAWPERFPREIVDEWKDSIGPTMIAAQLQQRPVPRGGAIIKSDWWQEWEENKPPQFPFTYFVASIDTAYTEKTHNDPSACTIWGLCTDQYGNPQIHLLDAWEEWLELHDLVERVIDTCQKSDKPASVGRRFPIDTLLIEAKATGVPVAQEIERILKQRCTFRVDMIDPRTYGGDKVGRLRSVEYIFARKTVYAPVTRDWADKVIQQCASVPYTTRDDLADTVSMAIRWFREHGFAPTREEAKEDYTNERKFQPRNSGREVVASYFG